MKRLEDLMGELIEWIVLYTLSKIVKPDITVDKVTQLDEEMIASIKEKYDIEGVILDVDETIRKNMNQIPKCNQEWIDKLRGQLKVIIVSNGRDEDIEAFFKKRDIDYIGFAYKPLKRNFIKACTKMDIAPEKVLVVGNDLIDDICGGKMNKMKTALVKNVEDEKER